ncbi:MAG: hypothetical protein IJV86_04540 [Clostridia bacterium]|nr:hypothetical protein [Clostridia bacterium]
MKLSKALFLVFAMVVLCTGCGGREIDETAYIIALGIDEGEKSGYTYTLQFSAPLETVEGKGAQAEGKGKGEEKNENSTVRNVVIKAKDFYTARNMINNFMGKNVDMSHLKLIVFSKGLDGDGFLKHSQFLLREREVRPHTAVAASKSSAEEYIKSVRPELEANTAKYYELMSMQSNNVYSPSKRLSGFVDELLSDTGVAFLPIALTGSQSENGESAEGESMWVDIKDGVIESSRAELRGMAIFKDGELLTEADGDFAMIYNILSRGIKSCTLSLKNPYQKQHTISFRLRIPHQAEYSVDAQKKPCRILVTQGLGVEFLGGELPEGFSSYEDLYAYARSVLTERFTEYFYDLARGKRADIMKIGNSRKARLLTEAEWKPEEWEKTFEGAEFVVNVYFI